jgi:aminoglycoside phosphotransferase (APT) family kinase protein
MTGRPDDGNEHGVRIVGDGPPGVEVLAFLGRGRLGETWRVRTPSGAVATAKRLRAGAGAAECEALGRLTAIREPELVAVLGAEYRDGRVWVFSELREGVTLRRLLAVASLTTGQWAVVARSVLAGLDALHRRGLVHGALHPGNVLVALDGGVRLADGGLAAPAPSPAELDGLRHRDLSAAWTLLCTATAAAGRRSGWPAALAGALAATPQDMRARDTVRTFLEAADGLGGAEAATRARAQLAALVERLHRSGGAGPASRAAPATTAGAAGARWETPAPRSRPAAPALPTGSTRRRPTIRWLAVAGAGGAVAVVAGLLGAGHLAHPEPPAGAGGPAHHAPGPAATAAASPSPSSAPLPALPLLAPPSAGTVTAVSILTLPESCTPGASCTVTVRVDLAAHPQEQVSWALEIIDRCTGSRTEIEVRPMAAPASFVYVLSPTTVRVPASSSSAIIALTTAPAQAASLPLLIPAAAAAACE